MNYSESMTKAALHPILIQRKIVVSLVVRRRNTESPATLSVGTLKAYAVNEELNTITFFFDGVSDPIHIDLDLFEYELSMVSE